MCGIVKVFCRPEVVKCLQLYSCDWLKSVGIANGQLLNDIMPVSEDYALPLLILILMVAFRLGQISGRAIRYVDTVKVPCCTSL